MEIYVNPENENLRMDLNSQIFVDKSLFIGKISKLLNTEQRFVCVSCSHAASAKRLSEI